jgi:hypothetical protein
VVGAVVEAVVEAVVVAVAAAAAAAVEVRAVGEAEDAVVAAARASDRVGSVSVPAAGRASLICRVNRASSSPAPIAAYP